jgi:hypothetical protein
MEKAGISFEFFSVQKFLQVKTIFINEFQQFVKKEINVDFRNYYFNLCEYIGMDIFYPVNLLIHMLFVL